MVLSAFVIFSCQQNSTEINISLAKNYPRWLMNDQYRTNQTSGITFLGQSEDGSINFLLADDIGKISRLIIKEDTVFNFSVIKFNNKVTEYFVDFPKLDFEEIFFDSYTQDVYITIEGNGENHLPYHGIFRLMFKNQDIYQDSVFRIEKLNFKPTEVFNNNLKTNIGYEGFTADENYFYLGLENEQTSEGDFSGHTLIRIADKKTLDIIKEVSTDTLGIVTICGLYSDENFSLWGIDRNSKKLFKLLFDEYFNIEDLKFFEIKTVIPGYTNFEYIGSLESITIAVDRFILIVDDPWHTFFIPQDEILNQVNETTRNNFKNFIPVIYKFVID